MFYIIVIAALVILFLIIGRIVQERILKNEKENTFLKNIQLAVGIATVLVGGHFSYKKLIEEKDDKNKLPPVLNVRCKLEKVAESDTCYWLKATVSYENKSERRINILFSSISVSGFNITSPSPPIVNTTVNDQNYYYARDFTYYRGWDVLYSLKTESGTWYDFNELHSCEYIIKITKRSNEYDVASLTVSTAIANQNKFPYYKLTDSIVNGMFKLNIYDTVNGDQKNIALSDSAAYGALKEYGYGWVVSESQLFLRDTQK